MSSRTSRVVFRRKPQPGQFDLLATALAIGFGITSAVFFIYVMVKAPAVGVVKISVAILGYFQTAIVALTGLVWLVLNARATEEVDGDHVPEP